MLNYTGIECPVCGERFKDNDDIVVCPDCGAPYHRHCYDENGQCIFDDLHEKGESWKAPVPPEDETTKPPIYEIKDKECPSCGVLNGHSSLFCAHCGASLNGEPPVHANRQAPPPSGVPFNPYGPMGPAVAFDPMGGVNPADQIDENISFGEVSKLVQQNTRYYMPVFNRIKAVNRSKFNFTAFLFSGAWFLYRKQYKPGIILTVLMFALYLGQTFLTIYVSSPIMNEMMIRVGADAQAALTTEQYLAMSQLLSENPSQYLLVALPLLCSAVMLIIMIVTGLRGNRMYMKHCIRVIKRTKDEANNAEEYGTLILERGGVNTSITVCLMICYLFCTYLPLLI